MPGTYLEWAESVERGLGFFYVRTDLFARTTHLRTYEECISATREEQVLYILLLAAMEAAE